MEEHKEIKQDSSLVVTTQPSQLELPQPKCPWINEKGSSKGKPCGRDTFSGKLFCSAHHDRHVERQRVGAKLNEATQIHIEEKQPEEPNEEDYLFEDELEPLPLISQIPQTSTIQPSQNDRILVIIENLTTILAKLILK